MLRLRYGAFQAGPAHEPGFCESLACVPLRERRELQQADVEAKGAVQPRVKKRLRIVIENSFRRKIGNGNESNEENVFDWIKRR